MRVVDTFIGDVTTKAERDAYFAHMAEPCNHGARAGLTIGMETDGITMPTAEIGVAILDRVGRTDVTGFNDDPANVIYYAGGDLQTDIAHAFPRPVHLHLKNKIGDKGVLHLPPPGDGELDVAALLRRCTDAGDADPISAGVEFDDGGSPDEAGCRAAANWSIANLRVMGLSV
jgi:sugar phosphate isomerase/epimerase